MDRRYIELADHIETAWSFGIEVPLGPNDFPHFYHSQNIVPDDDDRPLEEYPPYACNTVACIAGFAVASYNQEKYLPYRAALDEYWKAVHKEVNEHFSRPRRRNYLTKPARERISKFESKAWPLRPNWTAEAMLVLNLDIWDARELFLSDSLFWNGGEDNQNNPDITPSQVANVLRFMALAPAGWIILKETYDEERIMAGIADRIRPKEDNKPKLRIIGGTHI